MQHQLRVHNSTKIKVQQGMQYLRFMNPYKREQQSCMYVNFSNSNVLLINRTNVYLTLYPQINVQ